MTRTTSGAVVLAALLASACGDVLQTTGTAPTLIPDLSSEPAAGHWTPRDVSCPDGTAPAHLFASVHSNTASLSWDALRGVTDYQLHVEVYSADNVFRTVLVVAEDRTTRDITPGAGRYRARVRSRVCGDQYSEWSDWVPFAIEDGDAPTVFAPAPSERTPLPAPPAPRQCFRNGLLEDEPENCK